MVRRFRPLTLLLALASASAPGHPGGLDDAGCHNDRKAGDRHCHPERLAAKRLQTCELTRPPKAGDEGVFFGRFVRATDGDTFEAKVQGVVMDFRLAEIDAPEADQPYGDESREELFSLLRGQDLVIAPIDTDQRGRTIVFLWRDALCVNKEMIRRGAAWFYDEYAQSDALYHVEQDARSSEVGLWALPLEQRMDPQRWRREKR